MKSATLPRNAVLRISEVAPLWQSSGQLPCRSCPDNCLKIGDLLRIIPPIVRCRYEAAVTQLRRTMGEQAFAAERERGQTLAREAVMTDALGVAE